jgi:hypothetical protein
MTALAVPSMLTQEQAVEMRVMARSRLCLSEYRKSCWTPARQSVDGVDCSDHERRAGFLDLETPLVAPP